MRWLSQIWFRTRALLFRSVMERELSDEVEYHVSREAEKLRSEGVPAQEALRRARIRFGGEERFKEHARESWGVSAVTDLGGDLRFAARQLLKHPAFSAVAVLTLALGIGGTVALSSVVYGLMLRPLPIADEDRVVTWWSPYNWRGSEFDHVREIPRSFEEVAAFSNDGHTLRTDAGSSIVVSTVGSAELFDVLGVAPMLGRTFRAGDDRPGAEPVVVLSHALWTQQLGADASVVGRRVNLGGTMRTVVGVMPEGFYFPTPDSEVYLPLNLDPADGAYSGNGWLVLVGRLHPDVGETQIADDLDRVATALGERFEYPAEWDRTRNPSVTPVRDYLLGDIRPALLVLLGAVGLLLLMACVNVAALLLTKTVDRTREVAVRAALGAGRIRLARQVLTESVLLGVVAGAVGVALAVALFDVMVASLPIDAAFRETLLLDWTTLASALLLAVVTGSLVAVAPMRNLLRGDVSGVALSDRTSGSGAAHAGRMQRVLVGAEVLLAVVLVTGASLLVRTVDRLRDVELGFDPSGLLTMDVMMSERERTEAERAAFYDAFLERARGVPGLEEVTLANRLPLRDGGYQATATFADRPDLSGENRPTVMYRPLTPEGFDVLRAEMVEGRGLRDADRAGAPRVAVINESFARRVWGDESPLGRTFSHGFFGGVVRVVGVVRDMAVTDLVGEPPMTAYYAWQQTEAGSPFALVIARAAAGDPKALAPALRSIAAELDPSVAVGRIATMEEALDAEMSEALRLRFFLGLFSLLGIVLGSVGVYGVVSYSVQRRRPEFGIRLALGAEPGTLLANVLRTGLLPVALGIAGGTVVALFASTLLSRFLFEVRPVDPVSMLAAAGILAVTGIAAALLPALRASSTPPAVALRAE